MRKIIHFIHWQGIHIGAKANRLAARCAGPFASAGPVQNTDNTGFAHAAMHFKAESG